MWDAWCFWSMQMTRHFGANLHLSLHNGLLDYSVRLKSPKLPWDRKYSALPTRKGMGSKDAHSSERCQFSLDRPGINALDNNTHLLMTSESPSLRALLFVPNFWDSKYLAVTLLFIISQARCIQLLTKCVIFLWKVIWLGR